MSANASRHSGARRGREPFEVRVDGRNDARRELVGLQRYSERTRRFTAEATGGSEPWRGVPVAVSLNQYGTFCVTSMPNRSRPSSTSPPPPSLSTNPAPANASG